MGEGRVHVREGGHQDCRQQYRRRHGRRRREHDGRKRRHVSLRRVRIHDRKEREHDGGKRRHARERGGQRDQGVRNGRERGGERQGGDIRLPESLLDDADLELLLLEYYPNYLEDTADGGDGVLKEILFDDL